jgi:hypothetical protein
MDIVACRIPATFGIYPVRDVQVLTPTHQTLTVLTDEDEPVEYDFAELDELAYAQLRVRNARMSRPAMRAIAPDRAGWGSSAPP